MCCSSKDILHAIINIYSSIHESKINSTFYLTTSVKMVLEYKYDVLVNL